MSYDRSNPFPTVMTDLIGFLSRLAVLAALLLAATALPAQQPARSELIVKKGKDTVAVEIFSRDDKTLTSEIYQSNGLRTQYTMNLKSDGSVQGVEYTRQGPQGRSVGITMHLGDTLVTAAMSAGGEADNLSLPMRGKA